ncbi:aldo/keto reductase [Tsukamurella serpentis]
MTAPSVPSVPLHSGTAIPALGFGVWQVPDADAHRAVAEALRVGYRSIDTAAVYQNEPGTGRAIAESGLPREQIFLTTKLWNSDQGFDETLRAVDASLDRLGTDYLDLYLIHWPVPEYDRYIDTFKAFERIRDEGRARAIGVSNFRVEDLRRVIDETGTVPAVNQIELHPGLPQDELRAFHAEHGIVTEAWSPLGQGQSLTDPVIAEVAAEHGVTPAQAVLRWHLQLGNVVIPKSVTPARIAENFDVFGFELTGEQMRRISAIDGGRIGPDPAEFNLR